MVDRFKCEIIVYYLKWVKLIYYIQLCFTDGEVQSCVRTSGKCVCANVMALCHDER